MICTVAALLCQPLAFMENIQIYLLWTPDATPAGRQISNEPCRIADLDVKLALLFLY
jgi:hypothetical protein